VISVGKNFAEQGVDRLYL